VKAEASHLTPRLNKYLPQRLPILNIVLANMEGHSLNIKILSDATNTQQENFLPSVQNHFIFDQPHHDVFSHSTLSI